ncbi:MAG: F0F1 ATP synthase subunit gamma [Anaerolineales bacterium]|jgi:F-type H+-transporting ATPase subunit gamma
MTQTLEALKSRIKSVEELQSVVKTMKVMAAVKIRQYAEAVETLEEYNRTVEMGLEISLRHRPEEIKIAQRVLSGPLGAIVFGSDQGMVGQFNQEIATHAIKLLKMGPLAKRDCRILAVGRRVAARLEQAGQLPAESLQVPGSLAGVTPLVQDLLICIESWREEHEIEQILLFYNSPLHGAAYRARAQQLLPVDPRWLRVLEKRTWPMRGLPTYTLDWNTLFAELIREYFFVTLFQALTESLASENASRLSAMQGAEKNIEERLDQLHAQYHHLRQSFITEELMDVMAGYEALTGGKDSA